VGAARPQGWFVDPFGAHEFRYFSDGSPTRLVRDGGVESYDEPPAGALTVVAGQLAEVPSRPDSDAGPRFRPLGRSACAMMAITGLAAVAALAVVVVSAVSERPVSGLRIAVVPAVALLVAGQIWVVIVANRRHPGLWARVRPLGFGEAREVYLSPLPGGIVLGLFAMVAVGVFSAATAALTLASDVPSPPGQPACAYPADYHGSVICLSKTAWLRAVAAEGGGAAAEATVHVPAPGVPAPAGKPVCPYPAKDHGSVTCLSKAAWLRAVAAEERAPAGAMLVFFVADFGVAWSEVRRSRHARPRVSA
jgi:hypothetical protein